MYIHLSFAIHTCFIITKILSFLQIYKYLFYLLDCAPIINLYKLKIFIYNNKMGTCEPVKKHNNKNNDPSNDDNYKGNSTQQKEPSEPKQAQKPIYIPKYSEEEKNSHLKSLKESDTQKQLADTMQNLGNQLNRMLAKLDLNISGFVKGLPVESKAGKSDEELITEFESKREDLKSSFKMDAKNMKSSILNDHTRFYSYKEDFEPAKEKLKPNIKVLSQYKENMVFQVLCNHAVVFEEMARKLDEDDQYSYFMDLRNAIVIFHTTYFTFFDYEDAESLEKSYFKYVDEEFEVFNIFHRDSE